MPWYDGNIPTNWKTAIEKQINPEFVRRIFEIEVPEIAEKVVEIINIVRDAGYRTKIAVHSNEVDPVGACVGLKGIRIQNIVKELEGEKIDIVPYQQDVREYIRNVLKKR